MKNANLLQLPELYGRRPFFSKMRLLPFSTGFDAHRTGRGAYHAANMPVVLHAGHQHKLAFEKCAKSGSGVRQSCARAAVSNPFAATTFLSRQHLWPASLSYSGALCVKGGRQCQMQRNTDSSETKQKHQQTNAGPASAINDNGHGLCFRCGTDLSLHTA